eukprot:7981504-Pyramimonas_sp.AAC.1
MALFARMVAFFRRATRCRTPRLRPARQSHFSTSFGRGKSSTAIAAAKTGPRGKAELAPGLPL